MNSFLDIKKNKEKQQNAKDTTVSEISNKEKILDKNLSVNKEDTKSNTSEIPLSQKISRADNPFLKAYQYIWSDKTKKTYTLLSITFLFISILILFAIIPTLSSITQISKKIQDYQVVKNTQDKKLLNLNALRNQAVSSISLNNGGLNEYINFLNEKLLLADEGQDVIYKDIAQKALTNNVDLLNLKTLSTSALNNSTSNGIVSIHVKPSSYQMSVQSTDLLKVQEFIKSINSAERLYTMQKIDILKTDAVPNNSVLKTNNPKNLQKVQIYTATISFLTYYYV